MFDRHKCPEGHVQCPDPLNATYDLESDQRKSILASLSRQDRTIETNAPQDKLNTSGSKGVIKDVLGLLPIWTEQPSRVSIVSEAKGVEAVCGVVIPVPLG